ncbi:MAG: hypothetical protein JW779_14325 [Candidatus Thorarchaeota archaeon]|nr:hypothetical protein [Candidatus Thorarchaeota archaeon]
MSSHEYYGNAENVVKGQILLQERFQHDCLYPFFYAAKEYEAFGGETLHKQFGPPESGRPVFDSGEALLAAELPDSDHHTFDIVHQAHRMMVEKKGSEIPIITAVIAPLSLPVMLFGFETWMECIVDTPDIAKQIVEYLVDYTLDLSNSFFEDGLHALAFFNPVSSTHIMKLTEYKHLSLAADKKYYKSVNGAAVFAMAGSETPTLIPTLIEQVGVPGIVVSNSDNLREIKQKYGKKLILIGNLDNISMTHWSEERAESEVKRCIDEAASGGGYIICDHHGDIPSAVPDNVLQKISESRDKWGVYQ